VTVIDADSHIFEPDDLYVRFAPTGLRHLIPPAPDYGLLEGATPLGGLPAIENIVRPTACESAHPEGGYDALARVTDMDREGIAQMVCFPSVVTSLCRYPAEVEQVMITAYNAWIADLCNRAPGRLFGTIVVPLRDMGATVREVHRWAEDSRFAGITIPTRIDGANLDSPHFDPLWACAEALDLPILVHSGTARPPYPLGTELQGDNFFLMHLMHHPTEQMLALSALVGGGVLERHPGVRFGFFESGCGWVPWYLERLTHHVKHLHEFVPRVTRHSQEQVLAQCFFSCDPDECSLAHFVTQLGADNLLYASDYPHWDSAFPHSVRLVRENPTLSESDKAKILSSNARRLYPRVGTVAR
jgi:predicted TIM-barrel fold metal-dependent hydrolase